MLIFILIILVELCQYIHLNAYYYFLQRFNDSLLLIKNIFNRSINSVFKETNAHVSFTSPTHCCLSLLPIYGQHKSNTDPQDLKIYEESTEFYFHYELSSVYTRSNTKLQ